MLFENIKDKISNGHIVKARLGRAGRSNVDWQKPQEYSLFVQVHKGEITLLCPDESWAEYSPKHDYNGNNLFINEDYYMEVLDWRISRC